MTKDFPNALSLFDLRQFEVPPPYIDYIHTDFMYNLDEAIKNWIRDNCKGRYYIGKVTGMSSEKKINSVIKIGFEDPKELSYFMLACPHLKYK